MAAFQTSKQVQQQSHLMGPGPEHHSLSAMHNLGSVGAGPDGKWPDAMLHQSHQHPASFPDPVNQMFFPPRNPFTGPDEGAGGIAASAGPPLSLQQPLQTDLLPDQAPSGTPTAAEISATPARPSVQTQPGTALSPGAFPGKDLSPGASPGNALSPGASSMSAFGGTAVLKAEPFPTPPITNFVRPPSHLKQPSTAIAPRWVHLKSAAAPMQHLNASHLPHLHHLLSTSPPGTAPSPVQQHVTQPALSSASKSKITGPAFPAKASKLHMSSPPGTVIADATGTDPSTAVDNAIAAAQSMARQQLAARLTTGGKPQPSQQLPYASQQLKQGPGSYYLPQQPVPKGVGLPHPQYSSQ